LVTLPPPPACLHYLPTTTCGSHHLLPGGLLPPACITAFMPTTLLFCSDSPQVHRIFYCLPCLMGMHLWEVLPPGPYTWDQDCLQECLPATWTVPPVHTCLGACTGLHCTLGGPYACLPPACAAPALLPACCHLLGLDTTTGPACHWVTAPSPALVTPPPPGSLGCYHLPPCVLTCSAAWAGFFLHLLLPHGSALPHLPVPAPRALVSYCCTAACLLPGSHCSTTCLPFLPAWEDSLPAAAAYLQVCMQCYYWVHVAMPACLPAPVLPFHHLHLPPPALYTQLPVTGTSTALRCTAYFPATCRYTCCPRAATTDCRYLPTTVHRLPAADFCDCTTTTATMHLCGSDFFWWRLPATTTCLQPAPGWDFWDSHLPTSARHLLHTFLDSCLDLIRLHTFLPMDMPHLPAAFTPPPLPYMPACATTATCTDSTIRSRCHT